MLWGGGVTYLGGTSLNVPAPYPHSSDAIKVHGHSYQTIKKFLLKTRKYYLVDALPSS